MVKRSCSTFAAVLLVVILVAVPAAAQYGRSEQEDAERYGSEEDQDFASDLWSAMDGYREWQIISDYFPPRTHQGVVVRMYYNIVLVDGAPYHVIAKDSFGKEGAERSVIIEAPDEHLLVTAVMVQREEGYDPEHNDWFYAAYGPDGSFKKDGEGVAMVGRVGDGTSSSCRGCHVKAGGGDYIFMNDAAE